MNGADSGVSLFALRVQVDGSLEFGGGLVASGLVFLDHSDVRGNLTISEATIGEHANGLGISAKHVQVGGSFSVIDKTICLGAIEIDATRVEGAVNFRALWIGGNAENGESIRADALVARRGFACLDGFWAAGAVVMRGAKIGSALGIGSARIDGRTQDRASLTLDRTEIDGSLFVNENVAVVGAIRIAGCAVAGQVNINVSMDEISAGEDALQGLALSAGGRFFCLLRLANPARIDMHDAHLQRGITMALLIKFSEASIAKRLTDGRGRLSIDGLTLQSHAVGQMETTIAEVGEEQTILDCTGLRVQGNGRIRVVNEPREEADIIRGKGLSSQCRLTDALVSGTLQVEGESVTLGLDNSNIGNLRLEGPAIPRLHSGAGCQLRELSGSVRSNRHQVRNWILTSRPEGQPWNALAGVFERNGQWDTARYLRFQGARSVTKASKFPAKLGRWLYAATTGYGFYPFVTVVWLLLSLSAVFVITSAEQDHFTAAATSTIREVRQEDERPSEADESGRAPAGECSAKWDVQCLRPAEYTMSAVLPIASSQTQIWSPPAGWASYAIALLRVTSWVLSVLLLAGISGLLRRPV